MSRKDITDAQVVQAYLDRGVGFAYDVLMRETGLPLNVCYAAMERAYARGLVDYGASLRTAWVTEKGMALVKAEGEE